MKAHELVQEGFIPDHFAKRLAKQGYKFLGQGVDQAAFTVPGNPKLVLKIFGYGEVGDTSGHDMFFRWAKFCQKNPTNPFLPKFSGFEKVRIDDEDYIMMYQERLTHNNRVGKAVAYLAELAETASYASRSGQTFDIKKYYDDEWYQEAEQVLTPLGVNIKSLFNTLFKLVKISDAQGYDWDMHANNVMVRTNGQPVIVDPWV